MRWYCQLAQKILAAFNRNVDLVSIIDDFGEIIYREIDYRFAASSISP
jgi:aarF domain-containing kinase